MMASGSIILLVMSSLGCAGLTARMDGPGVVVAYFYVRLNELRNLTSLVEAIHYGGQGHGGQASWSV